MARRDPPMIPAPTTAAWHRELAAAIHNPAELATQLALPPVRVTAMASADTAFRVLVPRGFLARMRKGDPDDPLLRQVLPSARELDPQPVRYMTDPLAEVDAHRTPGLLVKYHGRALLVTSSACAVHCRYCFRRHFPYAESNPSSAQWREALSAIAADQTVSEVILSGGDPLSLVDRRLAALCEQLDRIPHLRRLRIHTRMPIVLPERVVPALLDWLGGTRLQTVMVVHANHANEIDATVVEALAQVAERGVTLLNQAVLLKGVNDSVEALADLSEALFQARVLPYYLHILDPVQGAAHFDVSRLRAGTLMHGLRALLPGYLVPRLVWERPGAA